MGRKGMTLLTTSVLRTGGVALLQFGEIDLQLIEALLPEPAVALEPARDVLHRTSFELARTELRILAARDETRAFQHFEVL